MMAQGKMKWSNENTIEAEELFMVKKGLDFTFQMT